MKRFILKRINSDRGDSNTISQVLWIMLTVVLVLGVGSVIYTAVKAKGDKTASCIQNSNNIFKGTSSADCK